MGTSTAMMRMKPRGHSALSNRHQKSLFVLVFFVAYLYYSNYEITRLFQPQQQQQVGNVVTEAVKPEDQSQDQPVVDTKRVYIRVSVCSFTKVQHLR